MLALACLGAISVPLNPRWPDSRRKEAATQQLADWLVTDRRGDSLPGCRSLLIPEKLNELELVPLDPVEVTTEAPFRTVFISRSGEDRETFTLSHGQIAARLQLDRSGCGPDQRIGILELHDYRGTYAALRTLTAGAALGVLTGRDPIAGINRLGITHLVIGPRMGHSICSSVQPAAGQFPTLKTVELNAFSPQPLLMAGLRRHLCPSVRYRLQTPELGALAEASPQMLDAQPASAGRVLEGIELRIADEQGRPLPHDVAGCIEVRLSRARDGLAAEPATAGERWSTTDLAGHMNADNILFLLGPRARLLKIEREWINPELIEQILKLHPGVTDAVVRVIPQRSRPEPKLVAAVATRASCIGELRAHCRAHMTGPEPDSFIELQDLPSRLRRNLLELMSRADA
jgi:acyl-CoA synthetase (AMP-forming)/AMP-acid ligase II